MALSERLKVLEAQAALVDSGCSVKRVLKELDEHDRDALESALMSFASTRSIHTALKEEGIKIDRETIANHRKGYCRCKEA